MTKKDRILITVELTALFLAAAWRLWYSLSTRPTYEPGSIIPQKVIERKGDESFFRILEIPDSIFEFMQGRSYKDGCTIPRSDLRYLIFLHRNIEGQAVVGEMVVNSSIAQDVLDIMRQLFLQSYPIEKARLIDYYDADDERSMLDNNTSGFNWRYIKNTDRLSNHSTGMAIDINPLYNPYHLSRRGRETIQPQSGKPYLDRQADYPYKIERGDLCYELFTSHGFAWGGDWESPKDYQHFEKPQQ